MIEEPPDPEWLYVPLHRAACGVCLRLFRGRDGARCAVGFTSAQRLASVLGADEPFYRLPEHAVRELAAERDVFALVVDPGMVAAPVRERVDEPVAPVAAAAPIAAPAPAHAWMRSRAAWAPEATGILLISAVSGAAALLMQVF